MTVRYKCHTVPHTDIVLSAFSGFFSISNNWGCLTPFFPFQITAPHQDIAVATPRFVQKQYTLQVAMVLNTGVNRATGQNPVVAVNYDEDGVETVALNRSGSVLSPLEPDDRRVMGSVVVRWWWGLGGVRGVQLRTAILGLNVFSV